jgi:hypothetical protein
MIFGRWFALGSLLSSVLVGCFVGPSMARAEEALSDFAQPGLRDFTASGVVVQKNDAVLNKIGRNFSQGYRVRESLIRYKEPLKLRVDAKAGFLSVRYVINGTQKATQIPVLHVNKVKNIAGRPGEAQGMLDSGIITPAFLANSIASRFAGRREWEGHTVPVFEFWYTADKLSRHHLLWMDPDKRFVVRHDVDDRFGHPWVRYLWKQPIQVAGIWVPTRLEVYSADGRLAAVTRYTSVKVNTGLSESLFHL